MKDLLQDKCRADLPEAKDFFKDKERADLSGAKVSLKDKLIVFLLAGWILIFFLGSIVKPDGEMSFSERRPLASAPEISADAVMDGSFMKKFETYTLDQFPFRDSFRTVKAATAFYALGQKDNNDIYLKDGYAVKIEYPLNESSLSYAAGRFQFVYDSFLKDAKIPVYFSLIPDKGYFLANQYGYPAVDYGAFEEQMCGQMPFAQYVDIMDCLSLEDFYRTDTHWRQEKLVKTAQKLAQGLSVSLSAKYQVKKADAPFYGVYYGQAALPLPAEPLYYLENEMFSECTVFDFETNQTMPMYDLSKTEGKDPYEMFLGGSKSLITIENPMASTDRELILFRDSFGSSIAPLFVEAYQKITIVDIRYITPAILGRFIDFSEGKKQALFLYSVPVLNNSVTIK